MSGIWLLYEGVPEIHYGSMKRISETNWRYIQELILYWLENEDCRKDAFPHESLEISDKRIDEILVALDKK